MTAPLANESYVQVPPATPVRIVVDVTRRCNLTCYYCHSSSGPEYDGPAISPERIGTVLRGAERFRVFEVTITGGEPLMWHGFEALAEHARDLDFTTLQLITNATLITDRTMALLRKSKIGRICVSLDGPAEIHDAVRGPGQFEKTLNGIQRLREIVDNITVITVVDCLSYARWPELTRVVIDAGVKQHHLTPVCFAGAALVQYSDRSLREHEYASVVETLRRITPELPPGFILSFKDGLLRPITERSFTLSGFTCEYFKGHHLVVQPTGKVHRAARAWGRTWRANECIGDINESELDDILHNEPPTLVPFDLQQEMQRKYHIQGASPQVVSRDLAHVGEVASGRDGDVSAQREVDTARIHPAALLGRYPLPRLGELRARARTEAHRFRVRRQGDVSLLFDTISFEIHVLSPEENDLIEEDLRACASS